VHWALWPWAWVLVRPMPFLDRHRRLRPATVHLPRALPVRTAAGRRPETSTRRMRPVIRVDLTDPVGQVALAQADAVDPARGMGIPSVATSTRPPGVMDLRPGGLVRHQHQRGVDRSRRPEASGRVAQSTIGATRKHRCGIPGSTSGASGSSESGSRCK